MIRNQDDADYNLLESREMHISNRNQHMRYKPPATNPHMSDQIIYSNPHKGFAYGQRALGHLEVGLEGLARKNFIKKVYSIVGLQLLLTVIMCVLSTYIQGFMRFQIENFYLMYVCLGVMLTTEIVILCCQVGRKHPYSLICLALFTLAEAYLVSMIAALVADAEGGAVVLMAASMTLVLVGVLTLYAIFTKRDFTTPWAILMAFIASLVMFFSFWMISWTTFTQTVYCSMGIFVFGVYLIIDTQMVIGNKQFALSVDDYIVAALLIYIDIIQMFLYILSILSKRK